MSDPSWLDDLDAALKAFAKAKTATEQWKAQRHLISALNPHLPALLRIARAAVDLVDEYRSDFGHEVPIGAIEDALTEAGL